MTSQLAISCMRLATMPSLTNSATVLRQAKPAIQKPATSSLDIIDIRGERVEINLKEEVVSLFNPQDGPRMLPTLLLYNEKGLQLFEDVCHCRQDCSLCQYSFLSRSRIWRSIT